MKDPQYDSITHHLRIRKLQTIGSDISNCTEANPILTILYDYPHPEHMGHMTPFHKLETCSNDTYTQKKIVPSTRQILDR